MCVLGGGFTSFMIIEGSLQHKVRESYLNKFKNYFKSWDIIDCIFTLDMIKEDSPPTQRRARANQPVHRFLGDKGLGTQQETSV